MGPFPGASAAYLDPIVRAILDGPRAGGRDVPPSRQVFVNRNLRMDKIEVVGFDMDYTLAIYQLLELEELAFEMTVARMVERRGWPDRLRGLRYLSGFVIRGLVVDKLTGNIFKMDRHNHVGRAYHGLVPVPREERYRTYRDERVALSSPRFAWIDTLFSLPEAALFAQVIDLEETPDRKLDYERLFTDIRECIDEAHRDGTLKTRSTATSPATSTAIPSSARRCTSSAAPARSSSCSPTPAGLHRADDALPPRRGDPRVPELAQLLRRDHRRLEEAWLLPGGPPVRRDRRAPGLPAPRVPLERGHIYEGGNLHDFEKVLGAPAIGCSTSATTSTATSSAPRRLAVANLPRHRGTGAGD